MTEHIKKFIAFILVLNYHVAKLFTSFFKKKKKTGYFFKVDFG